MQKYLTLLLYLLIYVVVIYHLTNYENFPTSPDYQFPLEDIGLAYLFSIPLVVLVEWYFQYATSKHLVPKKAVINFVVVLSIGFLLIFSIAYLSHPSSTRNSYVFILSLLLSAVSSFAWIAILYGRKLVLRWTKSEGLDGLIIKSGNTTHQVKFRDILYLHSVNKIVFARVRPGSSIVTNFSLAELESMLPKSFFRANRQFIISRDSVKSSRSIKNQKLEVQLDDSDLKEPLIISRYKVSDFRKWLASS